MKKVPPLKPKQKTWQDVPADSLTAALYTDRIEQNSSPPSSAKKRPTRRK